LSFLFSLSSIITNGALLGRFLKKCSAGQRALQVTGARSGWEGMAPMGIPRGKCSVGSRTRDRANERELGRNHKIMGDREILASDAPIVEINLS